MKVLHKVSLGLGAFALMLGGTFAYWRTTPSYALFDIGYLSKDLKSRVDVKEISIQITDAVMSKASKQAAETIQTSQNGFEQFGTMVGLGMLQQMRPVIEQQVRTKVEESINDLDQSAKEGSFKVLSITRRGNEAIASVLNASGKVVEFRMKETNGYWKFTGFSDSSLATVIEAMDQASSTSVETSATTLPEAPAPSPTITQRAVPVPTPVRETATSISPPAANSSSASKSQYVASADFNAEVFDPPSNCRAQPKNGKVIKVFDRGLIKVDPSRHLPGAESWFFETYQNCWIDQSQFRWLPKLPS